MIIARALAVASLLLIGLPTPVSAQLGIPKQEAKLVASDGTLGATFGYAAAIFGDTAIVGNSHGGAYVFTRSGSTWTEEAKLTGIGPVTSAFGYSVAISGDTAVVGDPGATSCCFVGPGAAFVFVRSGSTWTQQAVLTGSEAGGRFAEAIAVSGDTVIVGDWLKGTAYLFARTGTTWSEQGKFTGPSYFGDSVAISGNTALVGRGSGDSVSVLVRTGSTWSQQAALSPLPSDNVGQFGEVVALSGNTALVNGWKSTISDRVVYIFARNGTTWSLQSVLTSPQDNGDFAGSLAVSDSDDIAVVGVPNASVGNHSSAGLAYVFVRTGTMWAHQSTLTADDLDDGDAFGFSVGVSGNTAIAGAWLEDGSGSNAVGAAYVFHPVQPWVKVGDGVIGSAGMPSLYGTGNLAEAFPVTLSLSQAKPFSLAPLVVGLSNLSAPFKGGTMFPYPNWVFPAFTDFFGKSTFGGLWPSGVPSGFTTYFQWWIQDPAGPKGYAASNAVAGTAP